MRRPLARRLLPTAHVQFENMDQLDRMLNLGSKGSLPLRWPCNLSSRDEKLKKTQISWLDSYKAMRKLVRPSIETVKSHTDNWIINFDKGKIPSLPLPNPEDSQIEDEELKVDEKMIEDEEDGEGQWTVVTRGGKHGRSSTTTIPTQTKTNTKSKGPDPYAQSSMSARDDGAAVKVMKRGFAESFKHTDLDDDNDDEDGEETEVGEKNNNKKKRRVGGQLDKSFYKTDLKNLKKNRTNELRKKFLEDRQKLKSSKKHEDS
ncbi:hypothetical protein BY996DRAFT_4575793 [Phakopsora pachyrhizi]|uniref:Uncharacterized protein n=1 Tax=Phakopsora pachyrhizi TaxID=170000 RepID=A0AAV0BKI4_PHAPC|nr:hypothetical protein BY996DRAFT_4575793 [Phakopsora pachyrhizi]CAH7686618.1 hypothetical protein PPACK8108_LOCUS21295 [Phakopsora pachyrhizi]